MKKTSLAIITLIFSTNALHAEVVSIRYFKKKPVSWLILAPKEVNGKFLRVSLRYEHPQNGKYSIRVLKDLKTGKYYANAQPSKWKKIKKGGWHMINAKDPKVSFETNDIGIDITKYVKKVIDVIKKYEKIAQNIRSKRKKWTENHTV